MRLDKYLSVTAVASRKESARAVRAGEVTINGTPARRADESIDPESDRVVFRGVSVRYKAFDYLLLNKPEGYVSATEDGKSPTVLALLPERFAARGVFPCGRLDKNTTGLMLLTNNGELSHRLLAPRRHVPKRYRFTVKFPLSAADLAAVEAGLTLDDGYRTKPAAIELSDKRNGVITLVEGKYHQIKRMMETLHNQITALERVSFGPLTLPADLPRGAWRELKDDEIAALFAAAEMDKQ